MIRVMQVMIVLQVIACGVIVYCNIQISNRCRGHVHQVGMVLFCEQAPP